MRPRHCKILLGVFLLAVLCSNQGWAEVNVTVVDQKELLALFDRFAMPIYPYEARRSRITGSGLYRMYINPDGKVRAVGVMKSTGSSILDLAAAAGLYRWHAKPSRRPREVDIPVAFTMTR